MPRANSEIELRTVDEEGRALPATTPGRILFRTGMAAAGYWNRPAETEEANSNILRMLILNLGYTARSVLTIIKPSTKPILMNLCKSAQL